MSFESRHVSISILSLDPNGFYLKKKNCHGNNPYKMRKSLNDFNITTYNCFFKDQNRRGEGSSAVLHMLFGLFTGKCSIVSDLSLLEREAASGCTDGCTGGHSMVWGKANSQGRQERLR